MFFNFNFKFGENNERTASWKPYRTFSIPRTPPSKNRRMRRSPATVGGKQCHRRTSSGPIAPKLGRGHVDRQFRQIRAVLGGRMSFPRQAPAFKRRSASRLGAIFLDKHQHHRSSDGRAPVTPRHLSCAVMAISNHFVTVDATYRRLYQGL